MRMTPIPLLGILLLGILSLNAQAADQPTAAANTASPAPQTAEEIRQCARKNFPRKTSVQSLVLTAYDRSGSERALRAKMHWRLDDEGYSNVMIRVSSPRDLSGSSYLVLERSDRDDMFMYLPAVNRVKRILGNMKSQPLWGTDLSYEDVKQLQGVALAGTLSRLEDGAIGERKTYSIQTLYDSAEESAYGRVVTHLDQSTCMPLRVDFFDSADVAVKQLNIDPATMTEQDGKWQIRDADMLDLHNKTHTTIKVEEISVDESLSNRVFNQHTFQH